MSRFLLSRQASADLEEIVGHMAEDSVSAAERVLDGLKQAMRTLAEMPHMGHLRPDLTREPLRFWQVY
jgi:antitoxin ParD1/3/4/toxin ParE1/3/4